MTGNILQVFTRFSKKIVMGLLLLHARELRDPNIYLLLPLTGGQMDISGGFVTPLHIPRHTIDILDAQILKMTKKCVISCLAEARGQG